MVGRNNIDLTVFIHLDWEIYTVRLSNTDWNKVDQIHRNWQWYYKKIVVSTFYAPVVSVILFCKIFSHTPAETEYVCGGLHWVLWGQVADPLMENCGLIMSQIPTPLLSELWATKGYTY